MDFSINIRVQPFQFLFSQALMLSAANEEKENPMIPAASMILAKCFIARLLYLFRNEDQFSWVQGLLTIKILAAKRVTSVKMDANFRQICSIFSSNLHPFCLDVLVFRLRILIVNRPYALRNPGLFTIPGLQKASPTLS